MDREELRELLLHIITGVDRDTREDVADLARDLTRSTRNVASDAYETVTDALSDIFDW